MTSSSLEIVILSPALPYPPSWGFGMRVFQLFSHLARRHAVTLVTYGDAADDRAIAQLRRCGGSVVVVSPPSPRPLARRISQMRALTSAESFHGREFRSPRMQAAIDKVLGERRPDVVQVESTQLLCFDFGAGATVVLDEHNVESELLRRMYENETSTVRRLYNRLECAKLHRSEHEWWNAVDGCAVTSARDEHQVRSQAPSTMTAVVPNGVDCDYFSPQLDAPHPDALVFVGLLTYRPNLDAARYLIDDLLPRIRRFRPDTTVTVVGHGLERDLDSLRRPGVTVTGWVSDVRGYVAEATVAVVPIRIGGGTRLKVVEALAMGKAVVSTSIGCEGIDVVDGEHLVVADASDAFASQVCRLLSNPRLRRRLGDAGHELAVNRYSWKESTARLERLHADAMAKAGSLADRRVAIR